MSANADDVANTFELVTESALRFLDGSSHLGKPASTYANPRETAFISRTLYCLAFDLLGSLATAASVKR